MWQVISHNASKFCFVLMLLKVPVNSYGHVGTVAYDFDNEMNDTPSPAVQHPQSKQPRHI